MAEVTHKIKVFISSRMSDDFLKIRKPLKQMLEETNLFTAYCFEEEPASSVNVRDAYMKQIDSSQLLILMIDSIDGISDAVFNEYRYAKKIGVRVLCFFVEGRMKIQSALAAELEDSGYCKYMSVNDYSDIPNIALNVIMQDVLSVYGQKDSVTSNPPTIHHEIQKRLNYKRLPDLSLYTEQGEIVYSLTENNSPLSQILDNEIYKDNNIFLTGIGGQGKSFTLYEYYQRNISRRNWKNCIYIDLRMLDEKDGEEAIRRYILKTYGYGWTDIPLKAILLIDGINELPYGLRKVRKNGMSFILSEIKTLLEAPFRLVIGSRTTEITINDNKYLRSPENELAK